MMKRRRGISLLNISLAVKRKKKKDNKIGLLGREIDRFLSRAKYYSLQKIKNEAEFYIKTSRERIEEYEAKIQQVEVEKENEDKHSNNIFKISFPKILVKKKNPKKLSEVEKLKRFKARLSEIENPVSLEPEKEKKPESTPRSKTCTPKAKTSSNRKRKLPLLAGFVDEEKTAKVYKTSSNKRTLKKPRLRKRNVQPIFLRFRDKKLESDFQGPIIQGPSQVIINPYSTLGVSRLSSLSECKKAYKLKIKQCHPDKSGGSKEQFIKVKEAYDLILKKRSNK